MTKINLQKEFIKSVQDKIWIIKEVRKATTQADIANYLKLDSWNLSKILSNKKTPLPKTLKFYIEELKNYDNG